MQYIDNALFFIVLAVAAFLFARKVGRIRRNIMLGKPTGPLGDTGRRWRNTLLVAAGQYKMVRRIIPGLMHIFVYVGFLVVNIEVIEIVVDGIAGTHRIFATPLGPVYGFITSAAEIFMVLVLFGTIVFLLRRYSKRPGRFQGLEMTRWPKLDAYVILWTEIVLILMLTIMNASDQVLQARGEYHEAGWFPFSSLFVPLFEGASSGTLHVLERFAWWGHILGILAFLNYIPYSKHFHIFLAFPQVFYSNSFVKPLGGFALNEKVKKEVELMLTGDPFATPPEGEAPADDSKFGAKDVFDLKWTDLMAAYTCTECGRCTSVCPANITGKKLSPRKVMMDTRDRLEHVGKTIDQKGKWEDDGKALLHDHISHEEIWACTTCNACAEACPVNINPVSIIMQLRQYEVMEESAAPQLLNNMFNNVENAGTPWPMAAADRFNWAQNIEAKPKHD